MGLIRRVVGAIEMALDWPVEMIVKHFENRLFELAMATVFLVEAVFLALSPGSVEAGGMRYLTQIMSLPTIVLMFFIIGSGRIVALALNGHWQPYGPYVRAGGAALGVVMWLQVAAALFMFATMGNAIPFSTPVYCVLAVFEGISMFRALAGAKRNDGRKRNDRDVAVDDLKDRILAAYRASQSVRDPARDPDHHSLVARGG